MKLIITSLKYYIPLYIQTNVCYNYLKGGEQMFGYDGIKFESYKAVVLYKSLLYHNKVSHMLFENDAIVTEEDMHYIWNSVYPNMILVPQYKFEKWI